MATGTMSSRAAKRREITMMWMKQLLEAQEKQGTAKAAAAAWIGGVYALRAASRLDGNADWGRVGDEIIGNLEAVYLELFGKEGEKAIDAGRRLLQTHEKPQLKIAKVEDLEAASGEEARDHEQAALQAPAAVACRGR